MPFPAFLAALAAAGKTAGVAAAKGATVAAKGAGAAAKAGGAAAKAGGFFAKLGHAGSSLMKGMNTMSPFMDSLQGMMGGGAQQVPQSPMFIGGGSVSGVPIAGLNSAAPMPQQQLQGMNPAQLQMMRYRNSQLGGFNGGF